MRETAKKRDFRLAQASVAAADALIAKLDKSLYCYPVEGGFECISKLKAYKDQFGGFGVDEGMAFGDVMPSLRQYAGYQWIDGQWVHESEIGA